MPILKIFSDNSITGGSLKNITNDHRTVFMPKDLFLDESYKIKDSVFFCISDILLKFAIKNNKNVDIDVLFCEHKGNKIYILKPGFYVFFDNKNIEPENFKLKKKYEKILNAIQNSI